MTEQDLQAIAARAEANAHFRVDDVYPPPIGSPLHEIARSDVPALVAEVRRLRGALREIRDSCRPPWEEWQDWKVQMQREDIAETAGAAIGEYLP